MVQTRKILVRSTNWIGDAIMLTPALTRLREYFPEAHIAVTARPWVLPVFSSNPHVNEVIAAEQTGGPGNIGKILKSASAVKKKGFDTAVIFPNSFSAAFTAWLSAIPRRIGYKTDMRGMLLTEGVEVPEWKSRKHEVFYYCNLVDSLAGDRRSDSRPELLIVTDSAADKWCQKFCRRSDIRQDDIVIGFNPGAAFGPAKCWPVEHFQRLGSMLLSSAELSSWRVWIVVLGTEKEKEVGDAICSSAGTQAINLCGKTDLSQVMSVIKRLDLLITNDSGLMHVGAALSRPLIALFGSTNPVTTGPWSDRSRIVQNRVQCAPCLRRTCPSDFECMKGITPEQVYEACMEQIEEYVL